MSVLKAKRALMTLLVDKMVEYFKFTDESESASDIVQEIANQYEFLID